LLSRTLKHRKKAKSVEWYSPTSSSLPPDHAYLRANSSRDQHLSRGRAVEQAGKPARSVPLSDPGPRYRESKVRRSTSRRRAKSGRMQVPGALRTPKMLPMGSRASVHVLMRKSRHRIDIGAHVLGRDRERRRSRRPGAGAAPRRCHADRALPVPAPPTPQIG